MNDELKVDAIDPTKETRPMVCPICRVNEGTYYGRLSFFPFRTEHCPMHKKAIKQGTLTLEQIALVPAKAAKA